jgi:hypothetical protein
VERAEAKVFARRERYKKHFNYATSPKSVAQVTEAFQKLSGPTPFVKTAFVPLDESEVY